MAAVSGAALGLSTWQPSLPAGLFFFHALLFYSLRVDRVSPTLRFGIVRGLASGLCFSLVALAWLPVVLVRHRAIDAPLAFPIFLLACVLEALPIALGAGLAAPLLRRGSLTFLIFPAALTFSFSAVPLILPYRPGHLASLPIAQVAELGGVPAVDFLTGALACALVEGLLTLRRRPMVSAVALTFATILVGEARIEAIEAARRRAPILRVGAVQPHVTRARAADPAADMSRLRDLQRASRALEEAGVDLLVWPEAALPWPLSRLEDRDRPPPRAVLGSELRGPLLFGAITRHGPCRRWNSMLLVESDGRFAARIDKVALFPFTETIPAWSLSSYLQGRFPCGGFEWGLPHSPVGVAGARIGLLGCYDDVEPRHARRLVGGGAELLVQMGSNAWFVGTPVARLHRRVARFRAIESRRDLARVVNAGHIALVSASGVDAALGAVDRPGSLVLPVRRLVSTTPFVRLGDWVTPFCASFLLALTLALGRGDQRRAARLGGAW